MASSSEKTSGIKKPKLVLGNIASGGRPLCGKMRMFRMGLRKLSSYEYDTLDLSQLQTPSGAHGPASEHIVVNEVDRYFDRAGKGKPGATVTDPRMSSGAVVFIPMEVDAGELASDHLWSWAYGKTWGSLEASYAWSFRLHRRYFYRTHTDDMVDSIEGGYRDRESQGDPLSDAVALKLRLTQLESGAEAYFDNSRLRSSNILWEFSSDGGRGKWFQLYELPNQRVRVTLPEPTQNIKVRATSNNPEEWVQSLALSVKTDYQNALAEGLHWYLDGESIVPDDYIDFDDFGCLSWPVACCGRGDVIYTLYWTPTEHFDESEAEFLAKTKMNDMLASEFEMPVQFLGGWVHIFAQDIVTTLHIKKWLTRSINNCRVICEPAEVAYSIVPLEPESITVKFKLDGSILPPEFYDVEFTDNVDVGTATVIVTGKGYYIGTPDEPGHFEIVPRDVSGCDMSLEPESFVYDGTEREPVPTLRIGTLVVDPSNYDVSYSDNVDAGYGHVTVSGKLNLSGERTGAFAIEPAELGSMELSSYGDEYGTVTEFPSHTVRNVAGEEVPGDWYDVSVEPPTLGDAGIYAFSATGKGNYRGIVEATYRLAPADLARASIAEIEDQWFNNREQRPKPEVKMTLATPSGQEEVVLVEGVDFYYSWEDNVAVGTARVIITGLGNYGGQCEKPFNIVSTLKANTWGEMGSRKWGEYTLAFLWQKPDVEFRELYLVVGEDDGETQSWSVKRVWPESYGIELSGGDGLVTGSAHARLIPESTAPDGSTAHLLSLGIACDGDDVEVAMAFDAQPTEGDRERVEPYENPAIGLFAPVTVIDPANAGEVLNIDLFEGGSKSRSFQVSGWQDMSYDDEG